MADRTLDDLNDTDAEAPGGTQATHSASARGKRPRLRVPDRVHRAVDAGAAYVREKDIGDMKIDLESEIREHPLRSLAIAVGLGYLISKVLD